MKPEEINEKLTRDKVIAVYNGFYYVLLTTASKTGSARLYDMSCSGKHFRPYIVFTDFDDICESDSEIPQIVCDIAKISFEGALLSFKYSKYDEFVNCMIIKSETIREYTQKFGALYGSIALTNKNIAITRKSIFKKIYPDVSIVELPDVNSLFLPPNKFIFEMKSVTVETESEDQMEYLKTVFGGVEFKKKSKEITLNNNIFNIHELNDMPKEGVIIAHKEDIRGFCGVDINALDSILFEDKMFISLGSYSRPENIIKNLYATLSLAHLHGYNNVSIYTDTGYKIKNRYQKIYSEILRDMSIDKTVQNLNLLGLNEFYIQRLTTS